MTEEIIIDGVNVAGCEQRSDIHKELLADGVIKEFSNYCYISNDGCYGVNCYYKQLKRLEQENEQLKKQYNCYACDTCNGKEDYRNMKRHCENAIKTVQKYSSALKEIRILATKNVSIENFVKIQNKINEVLK